MTLRCIDLCCGDGGWTVGFLAAGYRVVGVDIEAHDGYPAGADFIQGDILKLNGAAFMDADVIVASPPCDQFSRFQMPWTRAKNPPEPSMELVNACYRIRDEAKPRAFILENVRAAQRWLGPAILHRGAFYLWGDVALAPRLGSFRKKESYGSRQKSARAKIPFELAYGLAVLLKEAQRLDAVQALQRPAP